MIVMINFTATFRQEQAFRQDECSRPSRTQCGLGMSFLQCRVLFVRKMDHWKKRSSNRGIGVKGNLEKESNQASYSNIFLFTKTFKFPKFEDLRYMFYSEHNQTAT